MATNNQLNNNLVNCTGLPISTGLSGMTTNGVAYASGTTTLVTGSALTFDGTNFATTGSATATSHIVTGSTVPTNGMYLSGTNIVSFATNTTIAASFDASQVFKFNSGYGSVVSAYGVRAWVNFNGSGTIQASANVSSITHNGNGDNSINLGATFPDANYCIMGSSSNIAGGSACALFPSQTNVPTTTVCRVLTAIGASAPTNQTVNSCAIVR